MLMGSSTSTGMKLRVVELEQENFYTPDGVTSGGTTTRHTRAGLEEIPIRLAA